MIETKKVLGVYSDSGLNALELCLIQTDGIDLFHQPISMTRPYPSELKEAIYQFILSGDFSNHHQTKNLDEAVTLFHKEVINEFIQTHKRHHPQIDFVGYSGHTIYYSPDEKATLSLGNTQALADYFHLPFFSRFIESDFKAGGCGGPLFTSHYDALLRQEKKPVAIVSLGGILSLINIASFGQVQAFDIGIGTILLDHWVYKKSGAEMDFNGRLGALGQVDKSLLTHLLKDNYLLKTPPKSLDKNYFKELYKQIEGCSVSTGATTITAFIAHSIYQAQRFLTEKPTKLILVGGGIYNPTLVRMIKQLFDIPVLTAIDLGWDNDTLNAQSYAFLGTRAYFKLPISFPQTTGVSAPTTAGMMFL